MRTFISIAVLLISLISQAQTGTLTGVVTDKSSGETLISATVVSGTAGTVTDIQGRYSIELPVGSHEVSISYIGYTTQKQDVLIKSGETIILNVALAADVKNLDLVVVSAGRFEQDISETTVSIEVLKPNIIENKSTTSIDDALMQTPGVVIVDNEPQIRSGSGYSFGAGSRVMVLVDDLPLLSGDAGRPSWGFLPVENVEQVEVIKGASSVLYGSAALSGVIHLRTRFASGHPETKANVFYGVYSDPQTTEGKYWQGSPMMTGMNFFHSRKIGSISLVIGGSYLGDDGHLGPVVDVDGTPASSAYNPFDVNRYAAETRGRMNMNLRWQPSKLPGLAIGLNTNWLKGESLNTLLWQNNKEGLYAAFDGSATRTKQVVGNVDPYIEYTTRHGSRHTLRTRWFNLDNNNDNDQGNYSDVYYGEYQYQQRYERFNIPDFTTTAGLVGIHTVGTGELYTAFDENGQNVADNYAAYLQLDKKLWKKLTISAGARYEYFRINDQHEGRPVYRGGLNLQLAKATFLRASYGQGFRFPTIAERYIETSVGVITVFPNPDLKSESSYNVELGVKQGFKLGNFKGFADAAFFMQEFEDYIEFTFGQWNPNPGFSNFLGLGFKSVNTGTARVTGADFSLLGQGKLGKFDVQVLAGYTYTVPITTSPDYIYARSPVDTNSILSMPMFRETTYAGTSSNPENNYLKYRLRHLVRADVEVKYLQMTAGLSFRYNSVMDNIDGIFEMLDDPSDPLTYQGYGIVEWRQEHNKGDYIFDFRFMFQFNETHRLGLVVNNMLNREYAIRPLTIEKPRTTVLQYTITI
ncbi:MAG: TonB-dependent receptor [Flavobacteriales bacterium]|nr:TonB-dependent receptor [Flavobacteriales bacterium]